MLNKEKNVESTSKSGNDAKPIVSGSFEMAQKEFGLVLEYSESNGKKYLEIYSENGKSKWAEWCKYSDGSINFR